MEDKIRVLILEDVPSDAEMAAREIRKSLPNCDFLTVDNETDYLNALSNFEPEIIISDYQLPGYDGLTALKHTQQKTPFLPFIILTGSQNEDIAVECMKAGATDYVIKEHLKRLGSAVEHSLDQKRMKLEQERVNTTAIEQQRIYEKKLIDSEARAQAFLTSNPDLMFLFSRDGVIVDCMAEDKSLLIREPEEIIGKQISELLSKHLADLAMFAIEKVETTEKAYTYEYELQVGNAQYFESRFAKCGKDKYLNIVRDITPRKLAENKLVESESRYKALLEANPDLMFLLSADGIFLEYKATREEMLLIPPETFLGQHVSDVLPENISKPTMDSIQAAILTGAIQTFEYELTFADAKYFECRLAPCGSNKFLVIVRDITEHRRFERQLRESEARYRRIFETSNEGILCIGADCNITLLNQKTADMFGYSIEDIVGRPIEYFMFVEDIAEHENLLDERKKGKIGSYERRYRRKDGSAVWAIVSATPEIDEKGNFIGSFGMLTDITDRKRFEEELKESEEKYRRLFETANEGIWGVNSEGITIFVNQKMATMLGYSIDEMVGEVITKHLFPEDMPDYYAKTQDRISGKHGFYDRKLKKKDGSVIWFNVSATPVIKKDDESIESYAMYTDITERKHQEQTLQKTLARYQKQRDNMLKISMSPYISGGDVKALAREICKVTASTLDVDRVGVWLFDDSRTKLTCYELFDKNTNEFSSGMVLSESEFISEFKYLETANFLECEAPLSDPRLKGITNHYLKPFKISALLDAVIKSQGLNLGVVCLEIVDRPHHWEQDEISYACQLADQMSLTIEYRKRIIAEQELLSSEHRYRQILETAPVGIAIHTDGKVVYANLAGAHIMAANSAQDIVGMDIKDILHPDIMESTIDRIKRLAAGEKGLYPAEEIFVRLDGKSVPVEVVSSMIEFQNKTSFQVIVTDITERKKASEMSKRNELRLKSMINILQYQTESVQDLINYALMEAINLTESTDGFLIVYENDTYTYVGGANKDAKKTKRIAHEMNVKPSDFWSNIISKHEPLINNDYNAEGQLNDYIPVGHVQVKKFLSLPVGVGKNNYLVVGVINKVTDYDEMDVLHLTLLMDSVWKMVDVKRNEVELRKLTRAVEQSPVSILITDIQGNIEYANDFFSKTTGYTASEVIGQNPRILKSGNTSPETYEELKQTIFSGKTWSGEFCNKKKNGEFYWEYASISPVLNAEGKVINFIAVKEDITARKQITQELIKAKEEAEQMSKVKSSFLANMSHELRTPMVGILGYSELLTNMLQEDEIKEMANTINVSGKRLLHTLNQILDLSRVEANLQEIQWEVIELNTFLRDKVKLFEIVAKKKGIALVYNSENNKVLLKTDSRLLEHVVNDLINNAIKYIDTGNVTVGLAIKKTDNGNYLQIKIIDTGIGIPLKQQDIIFDAFRQVSEGLNRSFEGTGLGLTISKKYIELLGGTISLKSKVGVGSTFIVSFVEVKDISLHNALQSIEKKAIPGKDEVEVNITKLPHVLLIDDDDVSFILIQRMLKGLVELDYVDNGLEAIDYINKTVYSLILLDINLPRGIGGLEVLAKIKAKQEYLNVPVVAVTAYSMVGDKETFLSKGCSHYLSKPFCKADLVDVLTLIR